MKKRKCEFYERKGGAAWRLELWKKMWQLPRTQSGGNSNVEGFFFFLFHAPDRILVSWQGTESRPTAVKTQSSTTGAPGKSQDGVLRKSSKVIDLQAPVCLQSGVSQPEHIAIWGPGSPSLWGHPRAPPQLSSRCWPLRTAALFLWLWQPPSLQTLLNVFPGKITLRWEPLIQSQTFW